jgi:hypothetical protein
VRVPKYKSAFGLEALQKSAAAEACEYINCWKDSFLIFGMMAMKQATRSDNKAAADLCKEGAKHAHAVVERCVEPRRRESALKQLKRYLETTLLKETSGCIPYFESGKAAKKRVSTEIVLCAMECLLTASKEQKSGIGTDYEFLQKVRTVYNSASRCASQGKGNDEESKESKMILTTAVSPLEYSRSRKREPYAAEITGDRMADFLDAAFRARLCTLDEDAKTEAWARRTQSIWPRIGEDDDDEQEQEEGQDKWSRRDALPLEWDFGKLSEGPMGKALRHYFVEKVYAVGQSETIAPESLSEYFKKNVYLMEAGINADDADEDSDVQNMVKNTLAVEAANKMRPYSIPKGKGWQSGIKPPYRLFDGDSPIRYIDHDMGFELDCPEYPVFDSSGFCYEPYKQKELWRVGKTFIGEETTRNITYKMYAMGQNGDRNAAESGWGFRAYVDQPYNRGEAGTGAWKLLFRCDVVSVRNTSSRDTFAQKERGGEREKRERASREALKRKLDEAQEAQEAHEEGGKRAKRDEPDDENISGAE